MSRVLAITKSSSYERRRALTLDADERQARVIASALRSGFSFNWPAMLREIGDASNPADALAREVERALLGEDFNDTAVALTLNGKCIAMYVQRRAEIDAGIRNPEIPLPLQFAEEVLFTPAQAVAYWQKILKLNDEDAAALLANASNSHRSDVFGMRGRISESVMKRLASLYEDVLRDGLGLDEFKQRAGEKLPAFSDAQLETEFRTRQTQAYGGAQHELILSRAAAFPFTQFIIIKDTSTTWDICLPMGTAVNGKGYIAATEDVIWFVWRPPNHHRCRSNLSPISYLEAQRIGILAKDGRTKIPIVGINPNRPFGDPPKFATAPDGTIRRVQPAPGFGA